MGFCGKCIKSLIILCHGTLYDNNRILCTPATLWAIACTQEMHTYILTYYTCISIIIIILLLQLQTVFNVNSAAQLQIHNYFYGHGVRGMAGEV